MIAQRSPEDGLGLALEKAKGGIEGLKEAGQAAAEEAVQGLFDIFGRSDAA